MMDRPIHLQDPLRQPPPRHSWRWWQILLIGLGAAVLIGGLTVGGLLWHFSKDLPALEQLGTYQPSLVTQVDSIEQPMIGQFLIGRRSVTPVAEIPDRLRRAVSTDTDVRIFEDP